MRRGPYDGRNPITLLNAAGFLSDPIMSLPSAMGSILSARATAAPPLLPPAAFVWSYAFSVVPKIVL